MTHATYTPAEIAAGRVRNGITRLVGAYPFHAGVLERFRLRADPAVGTMGVGLRDERLELVFNPAFVEEITAAELGGVLLHEVLHVVLGHVTADRSKFPDREARIIAEEVTVNEFVREPLPGRPIVLAMFPKLPPDESTAERYRRLAGRVPPEWRDRLAPKPDASNTCSDASDSEDGCGPPGGCSDSTGPDGGESPGSSGEPGPIDNHSGWPSTADEHDAFKAALADLMTDVTAAEVAVPPEVAAALKGCGVVPGQGTYSVCGRSREHRDWRTLLRRYAGRELRVQPRYGRPPRRFPELAGTVPGRGRGEGELSVVAVVDTSGSMSEEVLERIAGELRHLARHHPVHVVECDCEVRRTYRFRRHLEEVWGRGGTDFRPPLSEDFLRRLRPKPGVVVLFTDGDGPAPDRPPGVPVIWCLTPGGNPPASWGRVVRMGSGDADESTAR